MMSAAYWVVRTVTNKLVRIEFNITVKGAAVYEEGTEGPIMLMDDSKEFHRDNLHVGFVGKNKLHVKTDKWEMAATRSPFPFAHLNRGKVLLDVEIAALYDADSDTVAPHGIFGQAYDGDKMAVDGALDTERDSVTTTKAQAEGAIEGTWKDYKMASKFATHFKYAWFWQYPWSGNFLRRRLGRFRIYVIDMLLAHSDMPPPHLHHHGKTPCAHFGKPTFLYVSAQSPTYVTAHIHDRPHT